jgi:hypothetical protein
MNNVNRTYNLTQTNQLFDLNGDSMNFDIYYKIQTENNTPFHLAVVNQTMLDSNVEYKFTRVDNGEFTGRKRVEDNEFQNYYLVLRADKDCSCSVDIIKTVLSSTIKERLLSTKPPLQPKRSNAWLYGLIGLALIGCGYLYFKDGKSLVLSTPSLPSLPSLPEPQSRSLFPPLRQQAQPVSSLPSLKKPINPSPNIMSNLAQSLKKLDV